MSASQPYDTRTVKGNKSAAKPPPLINPGHSGPTTFFLRSEKELEQSAPRGRTMSSNAPSTDEQPQQAPTIGMMGESSFGVESLADTISSAFSTKSRLSRANSNSNSNSTESATEAGAEGNTGNRPGRKRKVNPVHPRIAATGQRIISAEHPSTHASSSASPVSFRSSESPFRSHLRRASTSSSINLASQPLTPLKMSPQPASAMPSTPRSGSPKSFRLSDEEGSVIDDTGSQVIQSSNGDDEEDATAEDSRDSSMPQLVMPSIAIPSRRPFTEQGKRIGRLKVMVVGRDGVGKTSLIHSICRICEHIVHVDQPTITPSVDQADVPRRGVDYEITQDITETYASTRPYPAWWTDFDGRRMLHRRRSIGDGVLERNVCFTDTVGISKDSGARTVLEYFNNTLRRTLNMQKMSDSEVIGMLSGEGGVHVDAVLWLFDTTGPTDAVPELEGPQRDLFETLCNATNVIPLLARGDKLDAEKASARKDQIVDLIQDCGLETYSLADGEQDVLPEHADPLLISSALSDDAETIDASVLMSSQYVQPLIPSELAYLVERLFHPENVARMRHLSAVKFLLWRQNNLGQALNLHQQTLLLSPQFDATLPSVTSTGSLLDEPSKVLVPYGTSSYYRSASPSASELSNDGAAVNTSQYALAKHNEQTQGALPYRQVRLAKWAQDLQRSLNNERKRYQQIYLNPLTDTTYPSSSTDADEKALVTTLSAPNQRQRPARGRLGGDIAIIDPRDPLGVLAFSQALGRRGWLALRVAGGCGLIGAVAWWVTRNWVEVQEWFGVGPVVPTPAVPAPTKGAFESLVDLGWRVMGGW
ncbi:hypothetical protein BAUCODRAFT_35824 [Baudoinia panamericana UAMH 10762]|uniref:Septin-type G domain-containing protein n=1 Tax=Baudoinia panamericana (strain UAMH 10762) TaxID=717646 RepID=M2MSV7_BAUPA|nr:uncharacterized protein BAUCODRAFT_35824 [Baudoinia panamericana UAMH 10762]EMC94593.1 hypothetical protein BAUCODRAFT_35824 [Baudoinia panamericana UAMH 10762]